MKRRNALVVSQHGMIGWLSNVFLSRSASFYLVSLPDMVFVNRIEIEVLLAQLGNLVRGR